MVIIALALGTAKSRLMTHMLSTMPFSLVALVAGPVPVTGTAHVLDMVLSQVEYHSQDRRIPRHRDRMALMVTICLAMQHLTLTVFHYHLVQLMMVCQCPWGLVIPHIALHWPWMLLHLTKGRP